MSVLNTVLNKQQVVALRNLIEAGYAVAVFSPQELQGVDPRKVEQRLNRVGGDFIEKEKQR